MEESPSCSPMAKTGFNYVAEGRLTAPGTSVAHVQTQSLERDYPCAPSSVRAP